MSAFICPVCRGILSNTGDSYVCCNNHSFDIAKSGYVNLLLSKHIGKTVHGDNKLMVAARRDFLDKGYYSKLREMVCKTVKSHYHGGLLLDSGCGEGYYTEAISDIIESSNIAGNIIGLDISKIAVDFAAKRCKKARFAAASCFHMPIADSSCSMIVTMFAPYSGSEFQRVLHKNGTLLMVIPSTDHLWDMKQKIYDIPYKNKVKSYELEGFELVENKRLTYNICLEKQADIWSLFTMTPYFYRTGKEQQERLAALDKLETTVDFEVLVYRVTAKIDI